SGIIAAQAKRLRQLNRICVVDLDNFDRHPSVKRERSQQRLALLWAAAKFFETYAGDFKAEQGGRHEITVLQSVGDGSRFRLVEQQSGQSGGIDDLNGHPGGPE